MKRWVIATFFFLCIIPTLVSCAGAPQCVCNNGNIDETQPQCYCACYFGYLQPHCLYTEEDDVVMDIWVNTAPKDFFSVTLEQQLEWGLNIASGQVKFLYAYPNHQYNKTNAFVQMKGDKAQQLLWDYYSNHSWLMEVQIESAWERVPTTPPPRFYDEELTVYRTTDGNIIITVEGYIWLILALIVTVGVLMIDCCCFANDEETVLDKDEEDDMYGIQQHPDRAQTPQVAAPPLAKPAAVNPLQKRPTDFPSTVPMEEGERASSRVSGAHYSSRERR